MLRRARGARLRTLLLTALLLALGAGPATAATITIPPPPAPGPEHPAYECAQPGWLCFDGLPSGNDVAAAELEGADAGSALVLSEADASTLTGFDAGAWATSGEQGLLNTLAPAIELRFDVPAASVVADVLSLPGPEGDPLPVVLQAFSGEALVDVDVQSLGLVGESGRPEDTLAVAEAAGITRVTLFARLACEGAPCVEKGPTTSFWADTVRFEPVPEPGTALLLAGGVAALGLRRRR